jgi:hypothetical protein
MAAEPIDTSKLTRIGDLVARREAARAEEAARRLTEGSWIDDDDLADARHVSIEAARDDLWRRIVPQRHHGATLDGLPDGIAAVVRDWSDRPAGRSLVLLGSVGSGKTWAALAACRPAHDRGLDVAYWPTGLLLDVLRPGSTTQVEIADVIDVDRLVLDDLGMERPTDWTAERLDLIIDGRWREERPTVVTSNLSPEDLRAQIGERSFDRIMGDAVLIRLTGRSRRRTR